MRSIQLLMIALAFGACAKGTSAEAFKMDADDQQQHDAPTSHDDSSLPIDAPKPPIEAPNPPPIDAPATPMDAADIGIPCVVNANCGDPGTCCLFFTCAYGIAGPDNICLPTD